MSDDTLQTQPTLTIHEVRQKVRKLVPAQTFEPRPWRGVAAFTVLALLALTIAGLWAWHPAWYVLACGAILISQMWAFITGVAHDATHGAIFRSRFWREVLGWAGFAAYGFGMESWRSWHIRNHHAHTQVLGKDADIVGVRTDEFSRLADLFTIGSGRVVSVFSLFFTFTLQGLLVCWLRSGKYRHVPIRRLRANLELIPIWTTYLVLGWMMGPWLALWLLVLPVLLANGTIMAYVATQHFLRPVTQAEDPLVTAMSVRVPWFLDVIHAYASNHREHHLFPSMSHASAPAVRRALATLGLEVEPPLSLWAALVLVLATPRMYAESHVLEDRDGGQLDLTTMWATALPHEVALLARAPKTSASLAQ